MPNRLDDIRKRLREIYSETTVDHILHPRNTLQIPEADGYAACSSGCGENMKIWLQIRDSSIRNVGFWTDGCAATIACGSMATELAQGKTVFEAMKVTASDIAVALEDLPQGNLHCAELAARALQTALKDSLVTQHQPWKKLYRK